MKNACFYYYKPAGLIYILNKFRAKTVNKKVNTSFSNTGILLEHLKQFTSRTPLLIFLGTTVSAVNSWCMTNDFAC